MLSSLALTIDSGMASSPGSNSNSSNPFCLSTPLLGEYGIDRGCLSVPVTLSPEGVRDILEWDLLPEEIDAVQQAHEKIWHDLQTV